MIQETFKNMETEHTLYEWCLVNNIRILDLEESEYDEYMLDKLSLERFKSVIEEYKVVYNSTPGKPEKFLELRMYGLVPYNLSPIQQGIQFNHANDVYSLEWGTNNEKYDWFRTEWMTNILLNGGTSNEGHEVRHGFKTELYVGTMQQHLADLTLNGIKVSRFYAPDLNSMLTAIVFLVDERVFNKNLYPDFSPMPALDYVGDVSDDQIASWVRVNDEQYNKWVEKVGGPKNVFLREFLKDKKLA